jgi:hypothetical protein
MAKFKFNPAPIELLPEDWYVAQVIEASDGFTRKSDPMIGLTLRIIPGRHQIVTFLVFSEAGFWTVRRFCIGAGLELPEHEAEISLPREDCLWRIVYVEIAHGDFNGETREYVKRILPRELALKRKPELAQIELPANVPPSKPVTVIRQELRDETAKDHGEVYFNDRFPN